MICADVTLGLDPRVHGNRRWDSIYLALDQTAITFIDIRIVERVISAAAG